MPPLRAAQLEDLVTGAEQPPEKTIDVVVDGKTVKQPNPAYTNWVIRDQAVLGYLLASLTRETMLHVARCPTSAEVWSLLSDLYASQSRARSVNTLLSPYSRRARSGPWSKMGLRDGYDKLADRVPYGRLGAARPWKLRFRKVCARSLGR
jgi:hypothetical protein